MAAPLLVPWALACSRPAVREWLERGGRPEDKKLASHLTRPVFKRRG